jgi:hypothetical protein
MIKKCTYFRLCISRLHQLWLLLVITDQEFCFQYVETGTFQQLRLRSLLCIPFLDTKTQASILTPCGDVPWDSTPRMKIGPHWNMLRPHTSDPLP